MKRYLMFFALLGLGFGACKEDQTITPETEKKDIISKKADLTPPVTDPLDPDPGYTAALGGLGDCITQYFGNGEELRGCIGNIPVNTSKFVFRTYRQVSTPAGPPISPTALGVMYFNEPSSFNVLVADALRNYVYTNLSTQDSVDVFMAVYEDANYCVNIVGPYVEPSVGKYSLTPEEKLARKYMMYGIQNAHTLNIYTEGEGVLYPSSGFKYLMSHAHKTLKFPLRWKQYGFNFTGEYTNLL